MDTIGRMYIILCKIVNLGYRTWAAVSFLPSTLRCHSYSTFVYLSNFLLIRKKKLGEKKMKPGS